MLPVGEVSKPTFATEAASPSEVGLPNPKPSENRRDGPFGALIVGGGKDDILERMVRERRSLVFAEWQGLQRGCWWKRCSTS